MTIRILSTFLLVLAFNFAVQAQMEKDPILFTVNGEEVRVSEFNYIYEKTNGDKADYSIKSVNEYLDLYKKFKLKVVRAKEMKLDTIQVLKKELEGYQRQLADSYLLDKEVTEKLTKEVFDRTLQDVEISHILVTVNPQDTTNAYKKIIAAKSALASGMPFEEVVETYSEDRSAKRNKGYVGFVTAPFPNGLYVLENIGYDKAIGEYHGPVRSDAGYHIVKVGSRRPARGEMEAAHIWVKKASDGDEKAEIKIKEAYAKIAAGMKFEDAAKFYSDDKKTNLKGGYIGFFGINKYEIKFENTVYGLEDGTYSEPFESASGWHIVKRISRKGPQEYNLVKPKLQATIKKDSRFMIAKDKMVERIKSENNFKLSEETLNAFTATLDKNFLTYKWKPSTIGAENVLFTFNESYKVTIKDFNEYLKKNSRDRIRMGKATEISYAVEILFNAFSNDQSLKYEEMMLATKYPEFRSLMREYSEGILLFEATKMEVWDLASKDTSGLIEFHKTIADRYQWRERAVASIYTLNNLDEAQMAKILKYARKKTPEKVLSKFNKKEEILSHISKTFEKDGARIVRGMDWKIGAMTAVEVNDYDKTQSFLKFEELQPKVNKTIDEARGYIISDYQDYLQKEWIDTLENKYEIKVNNDVLKSLYNK
jgi:peptidyl-prolyl cis-trans isomerase SurA